MNLDFGKFLKKKRTAKGYSVNQLALYSGISNAQISRLESGKRNPPKPETLKKLADTLDIDYNELLEAAGYIGNEIKEVIPYELKEEINYPIIGTIKAGPDGISYEEDLGYATAMTSEVDRSFNHFWLQVKGNSMVNKGINEGDLALIREQNTLENHQIGVIIVNGEEGTLKTFVKTGNSIILESANPDYPNRYFSGEETKDIRIAGKLILVKKYFN